MTTIVTRAGKGSPLTNAEVDANFTGLNTDKEDKTNKGVANGYAGLDATGKVPANQLPSYVDDVLEFANLATFPVTGEAGKIYVALDTNKTYRWSGSAYIYITSGAVDSVAGKTGIVVLAKADVGLGSVDNTSDADKPISTATQAALNLKANAASPTTTGTLTHSGDIVLSGSGKRITGDFSNATIANRVMFQTSTVNSVTVVSAIPSGTGTQANFNLHNNSDPTNASDLRLLVNASEARIQTGITGSGTYLPMTFYASGSERMRIDTSGNVGIGSSNTDSRLTVNGNIEIYRSVGSLRFSSTPNKSTNWYLGANIADAVDDGIHIGSGTGVGGTRYVQIAQGGVTVTQPVGLGYGYGSGGTVTQATSKSTAVTLNKPTGQITMNNAALAAGATVTFGVSNSLVASADTIIANAAGGMASWGAYRVHVSGVGVGGFSLTVTNISGGSFSEALIINFAIIKGAVA